MAAENTRDIRIALKIEVLSIVRSTIQGKRRKCKLSDITRELDKSHGPKTKFKSLAGCSLKKFLVEDCGLMNIDGDNIEVVPDELRQLIERARRPAKEAEQNAPASEVYRTEDSQAESQAESQEESQKENIQIQAERLASEVHRMEDSQVEGQAESQEEGQEENIQVQAERSIGPMKDVSFFTKPKHNPGR